MHTQILNRCLKQLVIIALSLATNVAFAIDNPDTPDFVGDFELREHVFLEQINNPNNGSRDYLIAYDNYQQFLDNELNSAYQLLKSKLPTERQEDLRCSQSNWLAFRDTEIEMITNTWTRENFGSSAGMSRGDYHSTLLKNRVLQLLNYAKNF